MDFVVWCPLQDIFSCQIFDILIDFVDGLHPRQDSMDVSCAMEVECRCNEILKPLERRRQRERHRCLAHSLVGTPNYIAPEVLLREGKNSLPYENRREGVYTASVCMYSAHLQ
jgi:hypothetical protein